MIFKAIQAFIFPKRCCHCQELALEEAFFCKSCLEHFCLMDTFGRCPRCFQDSCVSCNFPFQESLACFERASPASSFTKMVEHTEDFSLTASLLVVQLYKKSWDIFALQALSDPFSQKLAKALSKAVDLPLIGRSTSALQGKNLLVIGRSLSDKELWQDAARKASHSFPKSFYALALLE